MKANRVLYKNIVDRDECTLRKSTSSAFKLNLFELFCDLFWILVCNRYELERSGRTVYGESVESISFFMSYICLHNTHFPLDYNCNQSVNLLQRLHFNLTVARLLHKYAYSLVKYSRNAASKLAFFKRNFFV